MYIYNCAKSLDDIWHIKFWRLHGTVYNKFFVLGNGYKVPDSIK